jgi:hypothetical protein
MKIYRRYRDEMRVEVVSESSTLYFLEPWYDDPERVLEAIKCGQVATTNLALFALHPKDLWGDFERD